MSDWFRDIYLNYKPNMEYFGFLEPFRRKGMMRRLEFLNPVFNEDNGKLGLGENVTVRLGTKWAGLQKGELVVLGATNGPDLGVAEVLSVSVLAFLAIPQDVLNKEHDPSCRDIMGLAAAMRKAYGDAFKESAEVTVIAFRVIESYPLKNRVLGPVSRIDPALADALAKAKSGELTLDVAKQGAQQGPQQTRSGAPVPITNAEIENRFTYHAPKPGQPEMYADIRDEAKRFAHLLNTICPLSRESALAFTHLEEAVFWANASIARRS